MNERVDYLNLAGIRTTAVRETEDRIEVDAESSSPVFNAVCCLAPELAPDGARANRRIVNDTPQGGKAVAIFLKVRRSKCKACGKKGMIETLPGLHPVRHMTARLHEHIAQQCLLRTNTRLGFEVGVTEGTARAVLKEYIDQKLRDRKIETPRVIGMDEKTLLGELRTVVCNMEERTVMEMLPDRDHSIRRYFDALPDKDRVEVVVADMYAGFHAVKRRYFPNALHVYDRFHVVRRANNVMDTIRAAVFKAADPADRKVLARSKRLFMARADTLSDKGKDRIAKWSLQFPVLGQAYWAKERYFDMYEVCHTPDEAEWYYKNWQKTLPIDVRKIFMDKCRIHPGPQADAVFAYFTAPYTTGFIESLRDQFGQEYKNDKDFKKEFKRALTAAKSVYPDARIDEVKGGIRLYPSPPPVRKTNVVVKLPTPAQLPAPALSVDQIRLSPDTLAQVPKIAAGWDKYHLESLWREWIASKAGLPKDPDKAFLGWCKKFTKGKRPR